MDKVYDIAEQYDRDNNLRALLTESVEKLARRFRLSLEMAEELQSLASILQDARGD